MACCLDISDVELTFNRRSGYDVIYHFNPFGGFEERFVPLEGDYFTIADDIATLVKVSTGDGITDPGGGVITDQSGSPVTD